MATYERRRLSICQQDVRIPYWSLLKPLELPSIAWRSIVVAYCHTAPCKTDGEGDPFFALDTELSCSQRAGFCGGKEFVQSAGDLEVCIRLRVSALLLELSGEQKMGTIRPQVVLFGDSLTEQGVVTDQIAGWAACVMNYYSRKADVLLRGFGGYNTCLAQLLLDKIFPIPSSNPPLLVTVFFGANDAFDPNAAGQVVHVPLAEYSKNTREIVTHLKKLSDTTKIILITPPPVSEKNILKFIAVRYGDTSGIPVLRNNRTKLYAEECVKVGQDMNVPVINLWSIFQEDPDWEEKYLCDGLHFSAQGNAKLFEELLKILDSVPTLKADQLGWDFPQFTDFGKDPAATVGNWCAQK